jgi:5,10-methenyltetrahydromethanopterin hydrogenase
MGGKIAMSKREYLIVTEPERLKESGFIKCEYPYSDKKWIHYIFEADDGISEGTGDLIVEETNELLMKIYIEGYVNPTLLTKLYDLITAGIVKKEKEE